MVSETKLATLKWFSQLPPPPLGEKKFFFFFSTLKVLSDMYPKIQSPTIAKQILNTASRLRSAVF